MKKILIAFYILIAGLVIWGFINPDGIRGAWAKNVWSTTFVQAYFDDPTLNSRLSSPPATHSHSSILLVKQALDKEDYDAALEYITPLVDTRDPLLLGIYAEVLYRRGEFESAISTWESIGDTNSLLRIANEMYALDRSDLTITAAKSLYTLDQEAYAAFYSNYLLVFSDFQESLSVISETMDKFPHSENTVDWMFLFSRIHYEQGVSYQKSQLLFEAEEEYVQAINADINNWQAWINLGSLYYTRDKDVEKAIEYFKKVMEIVPDTGAGYSNIGEILIMEKQISRALDWYDDAKERYPNQPGFQVTYGNLLRDNGQIESAVDIYLTLLEQFPEEKQVYYELARAYFMLEQSEKAIQFIQHAIAFQGDKIAYYILAGQIYEQGGLTQEAIGAYQSALQIDSDNSIAKNSVTRLTLGD